MHREITWWKNPKRWWLRRQQRSRQRELLRIIMLSRLDSDAMAFAEALPRTYEQIVSESGETSLRKRLLPGDPTVFHSHSESWSRILRGEEPYVEPEVSLEDEWRDLQNGEGEK